MKKSRGGILLKRLFSTIILWAMLSTFNLSVANQRTDIVVPDLLVISSKATELYGHGWPNNVSRVINSGDEIVFFFGSIRVLNPTKRTYSVKLECVDDNGKAILSGNFQRALTEEPSIRSLRYGRFEISLGLDPRPGVLVKGQSHKLVTGHEYYFKVLVDDSLIAISSFRYEK